LGVKFLVKKISKSGKKGSEKLIGSDVSAEIERIMQTVLTGAENLKVAQKMHLEADDYYFKMHDADRLRNELLGLDMGGSDIPEGKRKQIEATILEIARDITGNPGVVISDISSEALGGRKDLGPTIVKELLKLKNIYIELESKNAVNPNLLATEIIEIVEDIRESAKDFKPQETLKTEANQ
jgi:hypothetical protein